MNSSLVYVELNQSKVSDDIINQFDCGNYDMSDYLHSTARKDAHRGQGVTYILVRKNEAESNSITRIYAYATIKTHSLSYYEDAEKYHTKEMNSEGKILSSISCAEIKMFAISRALKGQIAYDIDNGSHHYSTIFFKMLLEDLYFMSMSVIGFQVIFLRANDEGEGLYRNVGFIDCSAYLKTYDASAEGCIPLFLSLNDLEYVLYA